MQIWKFCYTMYTILSLTEFSLFHHQIRKTNQVCGTYHNSIFGKKWLADFHAGKTQLVSFDRSSNTGTIDVKMDRYVLEKEILF